MYCSKCGQAVAEGGAFCGACGQPVAGIGVAPPAAPAYAPPGAAVPYGTALPSPYAGFWLRVVAHIIDDLILGVVFGILFLIGIAFIGIGSLRVMVEGMNNPDAMPPVALIALFIILGIVAIFATWIYYAYMESSPNQGTLGKMALGLTVTDLQRRRISFGHATGRFFAKIVTGLIPLGIGYMMAGFTEKKQALHDMIASCLVLRKL